MKRRFLAGAILLAWLLPVASAQTGQKLEFDKVNPATMLTDPYSYGYQWWLNANSKDGVFRAVGIYGQTLYINPAKRVVIAQFSARARPSGGGGRTGPPNPFDAIAAKLTP